ncbi:dUTP diphosphatase [Chrysiogenes arsenatis]|uniref:dUTP diphosphatase n=1 Tax=Chrysiogenes arsenatis TaxID=309797 RepID=UPI00041912E3|nr:dUTP diphosphatase [Chrysiogenes arsenatis]
MSHPVADPFRHKLEVKIQLMAGGLLPCYAYEGDAGMDCYARLDRDLILTPLPWAASADQGVAQVRQWCIESNINPDEIQIALKFPIPLGFAVELPEGFEAQIRPRSGLSLQGLFCLNSPATIDSGYRGEVHFIAANMDTQPFYIGQGARICQMLILPVPRINLVLSDSLSASQRGTKRFGSSGI